MKQNKKETSIEEKKKYGTFSFISGLILLIIAVGLVLVKNGVNFFGKEDTPEQIFVKANISICDKINEELLEYMAYCGENARGNSGHLRTESVITSQRQMALSDDTLLGGLLGLIGLNKPVTNEYSLKNEDGLITVINTTDGKTVYTKETLLKDMDFSKLGKSSALKEKTIKKLLVYYEKMFFTELAKESFEYKTDVIVDIDKVLMVEKSFAFDYSYEDIKKAIEAVIDDIAKDKKWKKAFSAMGDGDFDEFIQKMKDAAFGPESLLQDIHSIKGTIYVTNADALNYAELTFDVDDKDLEKRLNKNASSLLTKAIDIDPVFTLSAGYTVQGDARGFKLAVVTAENVTKIDITGHGTVEKSGFFNGKTTGFAGSAEALYAGQKGTFTIADAQLIDMRKGFRVNGLFTLSLDRMGLVVEANGSNTEQTIDYDLSMLGKDFMTGKISIKDK